MDACAGRSGVLEEVIMTEGWESEVNLLPDPRPSLIELSDDAFIRNPHLKPFFETFHRTVFNHRGTELKYIPFAINMSDESLEDMTDLQLNGKYGSEIFEEKIKPLFSPE